MGPLSRETVENGEALLTLVFLRLADFPRSLCKVFLLDIFPVSGRNVRNGHCATEGKEEPVPVISNGEHSGFCHDVAQISPVEPV
jgi:hypothetical protein